MKMKKHVNRLRDTLFEGHVGSTAIESTILFPLMFVTLLMLLYLMYMVIALVTYSNIASNIAHQMNMRQSGYQRAVDIYGGSPPVVQSNGLSKVNNMANADGLRPGNVTITFSDPDPYSLAGYTPTKYLRNGAYFAIDVTSMNHTIDKNADQFILPYIEVQNIDISSTKPLDFDSFTGTAAAANSVIKVSVTFRSFNPIAAFNNLFGSTFDDSILDLTATGYDVIA